MRMSQAFPSTYLKAADLDDEKWVVTIEEIKMELVGQGEDQTHKPVAYFRELEKGLVLNKTNGTAISTIYGDESDDWSGQRITLFSTWVDFGGKQVEAIRVEPRRPAKAAPAAPAAPDVPQHAGEGPPPSDDVPF